MKIKLMIVALVAVSGLWGSERGQLVSMKNEEGLRNAFVHCIDTKSYGTNRFKRPIVICCFTETNNKDAIHNLTKKVIDEECKMVSANFAQYMNVYLRSGANINIKNVDSDQWIDKDDTNKRVTICTIYNITKDNMRQDIENLNKLIEQNESTSLLITGTSYDFSAISNELEKNTKSFTIELARELVEPLRGLAKELQLNEIDKLLEKGESLDNLSERVDSLSFESKSFGQKNKRAVGIIAVLGDFWENHWGKCMLTGALIISIYFNSKLIAFIFDLKPKF